MRGDEGLVVLGVFKGVAVGSLRLILVRSLNNYGRVLGCVVR